MKKLKKYRGRKAVSPVVATLILIIVAIVGAVAVGLIVSGIGTQTGKQANGSGASSGAKPTLIVGGSTTLFPAVEQGASAFAASTGINVNVTNGGSGAGMTGVALGVLDIGDASSASAVSSGQAQFPSDNLIANEVGGSGVVFISNIPTASSTTCTGAVNGITLNALEELYKLGTGTPQCGTGATLTLVIGFAAGAGVTGVSRSDLPSGTEDTACSYLNTNATQQPCASASNNAVALAGAGAVGNAGVLAYVVGHTGTIGFVDLGFAEGAATTPGSTTAQSGILQVFSNVSNESDIVDCATGAKAQNCFAVKGESTSNLHAFIQKGLSQTAGTSSSPTFPDVGLSTTTGLGSTGLTRTFWMVTKGPATAESQQFITFMQSPANVGYWHSAGYFSVYDITPITPP
jgi:phosphate transport system substrate-binding protein